jgi:hypothetical protein
MAVKIEWILAVSIVSIWLFSYEFKIQQQKRVKVKSSKNLEFYDTDFTKVDTKGIVSIVNTKHGIRKKNILDVYDINYTDKQIKFLVSDKAKWINDVLYLDGNVSVYQKDGFKCFTQSAVYDKKSSILKIPDSFVAKLNGDTLNGVKLIYNLNTKILKASDVDALLEL